MSLPDVFRAETSRLCDFLYAEVGIELNGSVLTVLSMLARFGDDPGSSAAFRARKSKTLAVEWLTANIRRMPLGVNSLDTAQSTATDWSMLLPTELIAVGTPARTRKSSILPDWLRTLFFCSCPMVSR